MKIQVKDIEDKPKEKVFHPFVLEFEIESENDLLELIARFNMSIGEVNDDLREQGLPVIKNIRHDMRNWSYLDTLYNNKPYMK